MNIIELEDRDSTVLVVDHICAACVYDDHHNPNGFRLVVLMVNRNGGLTHRYDNQSKRDLDYVMLKKKMKEVDLRPEIVVRLPHGFGPR